MNLISRRISIRLGNRGNGGFTGITPRPRPDRARHPGTQWLQRISMAKPIELESTIKCRLCGSGTILLGARRGLLTQKLFDLHRCFTCQFALVAVPWTRYASIYSGHYLRGRGADPLVGYVAETV